jgi:hypothetical protein
MDHSFALAVDSRVGRKKKEKRGESRFHEFCNIWLADHPKNTSLTEVGIINIIVAFQGHAKMIIYTPKYALIDQAPSSVSPLSLKIRLNREAQAEGLVYFKHANVSSVYEYLLY